MSKFINPHNSQRPLVFLDMDGVIADYKAAIIRLMGDPPKTWEYKTYLSYYITEEQLIGRIANCDDFWDDMPITPAGRLIVNFLLEFAELRIVSDPVYCQDWTCKTHWMQKNFNIKSSSVILTPDKHLLAGQYRVLIDDYQPHIKKWTEHGGAAFWWETNKDDIEQLVKLKEFFKSNFNS